MMNIVDRLRHGLIPAVPTPFTAKEIDVDSLSRYAGWLSAQPVAGLAVWAHTGRGLHLSSEQRGEVLREWRSAAIDKIIVAGAGGAFASKSSEEYTNSALVMAQQAKDLGADALLCYAPIFYRDMPDRNELILQHHVVLSEVGLPMILFYLYEEAGGISYSTDLLRQLLKLDRVIGIKIATLDSVITYQNLAALCKEIVPDKLVITGEDRFLGYSLMCGADAALIGMGAAYTSIQSELLASYYGDNLPRFHQLDRLIDKLGMLTFKQPMEGYIARMSYILARQGIIGETSWQDPWGPAISPEELSLIDHFISENL